MFVVVVVVVVLVVVNVFIPAINWQDLAITVLNVMTFYFAGMKWDWPFGSNSILKNCNGR